MRITRGALRSRANRSLIRIGLVTAALVVCCPILAQENCVNGVDDDSDGLIDLNDFVDCPCTSVGPGSLPSIFPNPSFEAFTTCPDSHSQMSYVEGWSDVTSGTTDYLNTCGFIFEAANAGLLPFPDGNGVVAVAVQPAYKEYVGGCLPVVLQAGIEYIVRFDVAGSALNPGLPPGESACGNINGLLEAMDLAIFGAAACSAIPAITFQCPLADGPQWSVLGSAPYTPVQAWQQVAINFTPSQDMQAIMIGAECFTPPSYGDFIDSSFCTPYLYFDRFIVNTRTVLESPLDAITADVCEAPVVMQGELTGPLPAGAQFQWYANGVAIVGANALTYTAPGSAGEYQLALFDGSACVLTDTFSIDGPGPQASISGYSGEAQQPGTSVTLVDASTGATAIEWTGCNGEVTTDAALTFVLPDAPTCCISLAASNALCTDVQTICIDIALGAVIDVPNVFSPNGDGTNDHFILETEGVSSLEGAIMNRWGQTIHTWSGTSGTAWNGRIASTEAPEGTYYYVINYADAKGREDVITGYVTLLR